MNRDWEMYKNDKFNIRIKNVALKDYLYSNRKLYLQFVYIDGYDSDSSYYEGFDYRLKAFVLKMEATTTDEFMSIVRAFQYYITEMEPVTIMFNEDHFFEILIHNGGDYDEGWLADFGYFQYTNCTLFCENKLQKLEMWEDMATYKQCHYLLSKIEDLQIPAYDEAMSELKYAKLKKMLRLCVEESKTEVIAFMENWHLKRQDIENIKQAYGEKYEVLIKWGNELVSVAKELC